MALRNYSSTAAATTLSAGVTAVTTTLTVAATTGFPAAPFVLAVNAGATAQELVLVTNVAGTTLTVTRGYDSTVASAHDAGAVVEHSHAGIEFREANTHVNAASGVHGVAGSLVGTTDTQTLTNKTLPAYPSGTLGYAQVTASQGPFTATTDLTALTATVTVGTGRRIRVTGHALLSSNISGDGAGFYVFEGATQHHGGLVHCAINNSGYLSTVSVVLTPTAGSHTYKLRAERGYGSGGITMIATANNPAHITVEDIGAA